MITPSQVSAGGLLQIIRSGRANTRADLQRVTGLSRSTIGARLDLLGGVGWLRHVSGTSTGGRPSSRIEFDPGHASVIAVDLDTRHARVAVLDLAGTVLAETTAPLDITDGPEPVLDRLATWLPDLITRAGTTPARVAGIGLSVPGPVDWESGRVIEPPSCRAGTATPYGNGSSTPTPNTCTPNAPTAGLCPSSSTTTPT